MHINNIVFFIEMFIVSAVMSLYFLEVYVICKKSNRHLFKSSFYVLFVFGAFMDLIFEIVTTLSYRMPYTPIFNEFTVANANTLWLQICFAMTFYCESVGDFSVVFIAINRLTAVVAGTRHEQIWRYLTPISIVTILCGPLSLLWYMFLQPVHYVPVVIDGEVVYTGVPDTVTFPEYNHGVRMAFSMGGAALICLVLYTTAAFYVRCRNIKQTDYDRKLFYYGVIMFLLGVIFAIYEMYIAVAEASKTINWIWIFNTVSWLIDLKCLPSAILIFVLSRNVRRKCLETIGFYRIRPNVIYSSQSVNTTIASRNFIIT